VGAFTGYRDLRSVNAYWRAVTPTRETGRQDAPRLCGGSGSIARIGSKRDNRSAQGAPLGRSVEPGAAHERSEAGHAPTNPASLACSCLSRCGPNRYHRLPPRVAFPRRGQVCTSNPHDVNKAVTLPPHGQPNRFVWCSPVARDAWFLISIGLIVLAIVIALRSILLSA
jgi:hypothetical protein